MEEVEKVEVELEDHEKDEKNKKDNDLDQGDAREEV